MGYFHFRTFGGRETNLEETGEVESTYVGISGDYEPKWGRLGFFSYPFGTPREPDARYISLEGGWKPTRRLYLSLHHNRRWYEEQTADQENEWNCRFKTTYSFARDLSLRADVELNSDEAGFANLLFRWKYRRKSFLYVGFNSLDEEEEENARMLFVKATYSF